MTSITQKIDETYMSSKLGVCRILTGVNQESNDGLGFLIADSVLVTCHHIIKSRDNLKNTFAEFYCWKKANSCSTIIYGIRSRGSRG